jgi:hypothetical protein
MTTTVNSKKDQLSIPEIIIKAAYNNPPKGIPPYVAILSIVKEGTIPNTKVEQYGNTVFITHFNKSKDLAVGRALNIDTAKNFVINGEEYFRDLVRGGTKKFVAQFDQKSFATAFMAFKRRPITTEMQMWVVDTPKGNTQVRIALDGELIEGRNK